MRNKEELKVLAAEIRDELAKLEALEEKISSQKGRTEGKEVNA